ncbi:MAG: peptide deformylase [Mycoplasma sp.]|nr:peptide deformylase [Candidatus Hennigella equi]
MFKLQDLKPSSNWILEDSNEFLSKKCKDVTFPLNSKDSLLVNRMVSYIDACYENRDSEFDIRAGIAVAAPQVGCDKKIIYIHFSDQYGKEHRHLLANPEIVATSVACCYLKDGEGCLSVSKDHPGHVKRFNKVRVKALDMLNDNKPVTINAEGLFAICLQHEIDHLSGILYYQRIDKKHKYLDEDKSLIVY